MTDSGSGGGLQNTIYRRATRSSRRMTFWRRLGYRLVVPIGHAIVGFFFVTCRVVRVLGEEHLRAALARAPSLIPCYWHQHQLFCGRYLLERRDIGLKTGFLVSPSVDGEIGALLVERVHGHVIRGSSSHTGARALRDYYDALVRQGISPVITPDGPRGPRFEFKPGALLLSQMSGRPILPMAYAASHAWLIKWDKFVVPWPFARVVIAIGPPRQIPRTMKPEQLATQQQAMAQELRRLYHLARDTLGKKDP